MTCTRAFACTWRVLARAPNLASSLFHLVARTTTPPAIVFLSVREWVHRSKAANMSFWVGAYDGTDQPWALCDLMLTSPGHHAINAWH